jgi:mRNA interferase RelE/StbE
MRYTVRLAPQAMRQLRKLDATARRRIQAAIDLLADDPRPPKAKQLTGAIGAWRVCTGDYRVVYVIRDKELIVLVVAVGHRRDIYR